MSIDDVCVVVASRPGGWSAVASTIISTAARSHA